MIRPVTHDIWSDMAFSASHFTNRQTSLDLRDHIFLYFEPIMPVWRYVRYPLVLLIVEKTNI